MVAAQLYVQAVGRLEQMVPAGEMKAEQMSEEPVAAVVEELVAVEEQTE